MKANEIQIGDWLWYQGRVNAFPFKVEQITKRKVGYHAFPGECHMNYIRLCECKPIPLTPEILEKNGFVVESRDSYSGPLQYCKLVGGLWIDICEENSFEGKLEYIHQLQHALRLCKIEKEIEL